MAETSFGDRLRKAFKNASNKEIAEKLGVSGPAVGNYMAGRVPDADRLIQIAALTTCDLHWLLTGEERPGQPVETPAEDALVSRVREIVREEMRAATVVGADPADEVTAVRPLTPGDVMLAPVVGRIEPGRPAADEANGDIDYVEEPKRKTG